MENYFFSVIIPSYNYGHYLERAINSVLSQNFVSCEVIVINDGSTDNTDSIMQEMLKSEPSRLRYIKQENKGPSSVRNAGVLQSCGDYILFLDADDALLPHSLEMTYQHLAEHPEIDALICDYWAEMEDGRTKLRSNRFFVGEKEKWFQYFIYNKMAMANGAIIIRREILEDVHYCEGLRQVEDIPVFGVILAKFNCELFLIPTLRNFKHKDSLRNKIKFAPNVAEQLAELLFDPQVLPVRFMLYRKDFLAHQYFQISRAYEKSGQYDLALRCYHRSVIINPKLLLNLSRHIKYFRCIIKWLAWLTKRVAVRG